MCRQAINDVVRALGLQMELRAIGARTHDQVVEYLRGVTAARVTSYSVAFFGYCHHKGLLSFEPPARVRRPYQRLSDPDFLVGDGLWTGRLRLYLEHLKSEKRLSDGGIAHYANKLKIFVRWLDSRGAGERVSAQTLKEFLSESEKRGVKASTRGKYVYSVRYFFDFLLSKGLQKANPATDLRIKADPPSERHTLSELEVVRVIEHLERREFESRDAQEVPQQIQHFRALRDLCLFLLFILTGVRLSEACGMRLDDLDFTKSSVRIKAKGNRAHRKKHREILLPDAVWRRLTRYLRAHRHPGAGWLWTSWSGEPMTGSGINKVIVRRVQDAGVSKHISPHRLRATCASLYVKRGMDPFSLKTLLGHESVSTTMDHYARLTEEELREVWKRANPLAGTNDE
jgi:integrase/recombinase XerD